MKIQCSLETFLKLQEPIYYTFLTVFALYFTLRVEAAHLCAYSKYGHGLLIVEMDFLLISCIAVASSGSSCVLNTCMRLTAVIPPLASVTVTSDQTATLETQAQVHSSGNFSPLSSYRNAAGKTYSCPISVSKSAYSRIFFLLTVKNIL